MSTYADVISVARTILNDTEAPYTWTDADLLAYVNDGLASASVIRPDLFETITTFTCAAGAIQQLAATAIRLSEVFCVVDGDTVTETPRESLDTFTRGWLSLTPDAASPPVNWARHPRSNRTFFLYPPATAGLQLRVQYAETPTREANSDTELPIPGAYFAALVEYVVGRAEMRDDEHANDARAVTMMDKFRSALEIGQQVKSSIDREDAAVVGSGKVSANG